MYVGVGVGVALHGESVEVVDGEAAGVEHLIPVGPIRSTRSGLSCRLIWQLDRVEEREEVASVFCMSAPLS